MNLAIVGSRYFTDYTKFLKGIEDFFEEYELNDENINLIVSGGAKGADTLAERYARDINVECKVFHVEWNASTQWNGEYNKNAGTSRNTEIVECADFMIAFVAKDSKGTYDSINKAKKKNIPVFIVNV